jgi:hypothetical protein
MGVTGTFRETITTSNASFWKKLNLRTSMSPLGIMAPETAQGAAFEKHRRSDARSIMNGKTLDVEYQSCRMQ